MTTTRLPLIGLVAVLVVSSAIAADLSVDGADDTSDGNLWAAAADQPGYDEATATAPAFDNKAVWPGLTGKERFLQQQWPAGRVLVWNRPGESAGTRGATTEVWDLANWTDAVTGRAPTDFLGETTDIILPPSETPYGVSFRRRSGGEHQPIHVRHVTVGRGASWSSAGLYVHGNLWVKRGGRMGNHGATNFVGPNHTFFRNDNTGRFGVHAYRENPGTGTTQYYAFNKGRADASIEILGHSRSGDEFRVHAGTLILGVDSVVQPGRNAVPYVSAGATLALMDGARFGKWCNQISDCDMEMRGTLQGGLPERPLTRDALFGLAYHNHNGTDFYKGHAGEPTHGMRFHNMNARIAGMVVHEGAKLRVFTDDNAKATLVIGWFGLDAKDWEVDSVLKRSGEKERAAMAKRLDGISKKIAVVFGPETTVEGVRFDDIARGGLLLADPAVRSEWKDVLYGADCDGDGEELFGRAKEYGARSRTY